MTKAQLAEVVDPRVLDGTSFLPAIVGVPRAVPKPFLYFEFCHGSGGRNTWSYAVRVAGGRASSTWGAVVWSSTTSRTISRRDGTSPGNTPTSSRSWKRCIDESTSIRSCTQRGTGAGNHDKKVVNGKGLGI
eukprot:TRINITY_DN17207_c0_g1_i1.p1 TRINITY_DN17207_c0_g1~~TRINITY_DN17207_c0_g1_i1.p1  ORF type:complete len:132 (-),score=1.92 TRINITY_DN17207_c0_g1_i1:36-431(-)